MDVISQHIDLLGADWLPLGTLNREDCATLKDPLRLRYIEGSFARSG